MICCGSKPIKLAGLDQGVYPTVLNIMKHAKIFYAIIAVNAVFVINLIAFFKRFYKGIGNQPVNQKSLAALRPQAAIPKPNLNIRLGSAVIFFGGQGHNFLGHWHI